MSIWFWIFAVASTFGFALQWALMTKFVRAGDPLSMSTYRSLSLGISMLPLLLFSTPENILAIANYQAQILFAGLCIVLNVWFLYASYHSLPIGISGAMRSLFSTFGAVILGWLFFEEALSISTLFFIALALLGGSLISVAKSNLSHLDSKKSFLGIFLAACSGVLSAIAVIIMVQITRDLDPFVAGYFWELEAGLVALGIILCRYMYTGKSIEKISFKTFLKILIASSPTLIGTLCLALAALYGPIGIASAVGVLGIVFITIFGVILFGEKLKMLHYLGITVIIIGLLGIKLF